MNKQKRRLPKKQQKKPVIPYSPIKSVVVKRILFEKIGQWDKKAEKFKLDVFLTDLLTELPPGVLLENVHLMVESVPDEKTCSFAITLYSPEMLKNLNYKEDNQKYMEKLGLYTENIDEFKKKNRARRVELKKVLKYEEKPRRKEVIDEEGLTDQVKIKNRSVK